MTQLLQWAKANLPAPGKDEDTVFVHSLPEGGGLLVGVADGISGANGQQAARWIAQTMAELALEDEARLWNARQLYEHFADRLARAAKASTLADSHSTLSCGIARLVEGGLKPAFSFSFFGIGDSPIWRVVKPLSSQLEFQASVVYGPPVPSEIAGLYSWVNLGKGRVEGQVHFGSVDLELGELLVVSSDGLPESRVLMDDQDSETNRDSPKLMASLLSAKAINDRQLWQLLKSYETNRMLIDDDASLAVVRLVPGQGSPLTASDEAESVAAEANPNGGKRAAPEVTADDSVSSPTVEEPGNRMEPAAEASPPTKGAGLSAGNRRRKLYPKTLSAAERKALRAREAAPREAARGKAKSPGVDGQVTVAKGKQRKKSRKD